MKRSLSILIMVVLVLSLLVCSCGTVPDTVATVNGTKISGEDFQRAMNGFLSNYGLTEETLYQTMGVAEAAEYKNNVIDELILQELMLQYAAEHGLNELSETDQADAEKRADEYLDGLLSSFEEDVQAEGVTDGAQVRDEAQRRYDDYVSTYDYTKENLASQFSRQAILDRVHDAVTKPGAVAEAEIRARYEEGVAAQQAAEPDDVSEAVENYIGPREEPVLYVSPAVAQSVRTIKHILLRIPDEEMNEIYDLEEAGKDEEAQQLRQKALEKLLPQARELIAKAKSGEDFDTLIAAYSEDPDGAYNEEGFEVYEGAPYEEALLEAALALPEPGAVSDEPVASDIGYEIIQYVSSPEAGPIAYESVRGELGAELAAEKKERLWNDAVASWEQSAEIMKHEFRSVE